MEKTSITKFISDGISGFLAGVLLLGMTAGALWFSLWSIQGLIDKITSILAR
jgi:ABC-type microcin C transport system permease subunit YejB